MTIRAKLRALERGGDPRRMKPPHPLPAWWRLRFSEMDDLELEDCVLWLRGAFPGSMADPEVLAAMSDEELLAIASTSPDVPFNEWLRAQA